MAGRRENTGIYRSRHGVVLGVCRGLARHFDLSVFWVRAVAVLLLLVSGIWPMVGLYLLAALVMKPEPVVPFASEDDREFYESYTSSRSMALGRLKRKFESLDRRIRRMEDVVTDKGFSWESRLRNGN